MSGRQDRLYQLLPSIYRQRDAEQGFPLQALLQVIAEQVNAVEDDIAQLYENWFIETCQDWVVPYIGDLVGYRPVHDAGEPGAVRTTAERRRHEILIPRREVANTLRYRRRKGTLALLELLARDVAGWPARAVELYELLSFTQHLNHSRPEHGRTVDLRRGEALNRLDGPFDELAHTADVRHVASSRTPGRPNLPGLGLFVWRLRSYAVTRAPAYCAASGEGGAPNRYSVSALGNDTPLYVRPQTEPEPAGVGAKAAGRNLPIPLGRRTFAAHKSDYYGDGKSLQIWVGEPAANGSQEAGRRAVEEKEIVVADLTGWRYQPRSGQVAVDPELGRIAFPPSQPPQKGAWVSYQYGFSADLGGGEYDRPLSEPAGATHYQVGEGEPYRTLGAALEQWCDKPPAHAVIEITDDGVYVEVEQVNIVLREGQTLQLRAARRRRPVLRLVGQKTSLPGSLAVKGGAGSAFTLDGLMVTGGSVLVEGGLTAVTLSHSTLVPGWELASDGTPCRPAEPSLELVDFGGRGGRGGRVVIEHCILGSIQIERDVPAEPIPIRISDCILDATSLERLALSSPGHPVAPALLTVLRSTVFGQVQVHALELGENSLFTGLLRVARRQIGCLRFSSYVPGSRTPRRFGCEPDGVEAAAAASLTDPATRERVEQRERERVRPLFRSTLYGTPDYARLAGGCAGEIRRGADDESEMGAFHDLYEPQRTANLRARLDEHTPAGLDAGLIFAG
ncbi:MAG TPA: hypothetical protein VHR45_02525 [Thermoanaerobaculia bacterium]|nr:hypothetical protein [Thermoanaerobaculia bacterium]